MPAAVVGSGSVQALTSVKQPP